MGDELTQVLLLALVVAGPLVGYTRAGRAAPHGAWRRVRGATLGGAAAGVGLWAALATVAPAGALNANLVPYAVACVTWGAALGVGGVAARALGAWLARRP